MDKPEYTKPTLEVIGELHEVTAQSQIFGIKIDIIGGGGGGGGGCGSC